MSFQGCPSRETDFMIISFMNRRIMRRMEQCVDVEFLIRSLDSDGDEDPTSRGLTVFSPSEMGFSDKGHGHYPSIQVLHKTRLQIIKM